jgi:hypothetical protein
MTIDGVLDLSKAHNAATIGAIAAGSQVNTMSNISCHRTAVSVSTGHGREVGSAPDH